jgi:hypothetical protein
MAAKDGFRDENMNMGIDGNMNPYPNRQVHPEAIMGNWFAPRGTWAEQHEAQVAQTTALANTSPGTGYHFG